MYNFCLKQIAIFFFQSQKSVSISFKARVLITRVSVMVKWIQRVLRSCLKMTIMIHCLVYLIFSRMSFSCLSPELTYSGAGLLLIS